MINDPDDVQAFEAWQLKRDFETERNDPNFAEAERQLLEEGLLAGGSGGGLDIGTTTDVLTGSVKNSRSLVRKVAGKTPTVMNVVALLTTSSSTQTSKISNVSTTVSTLTSRLPTIRSIRKV